MSPSCRRFVAATALSGMLAPWAAVIGTAVHLAADHHDSADHDHFATTALHGHDHSADTPDHEHGLSLPASIDKVLRPPIMAAALTPWLHFAGGSVSPCPLPAPAASPPHLAPIVLRT